VYACVSCSVLCVMCVALLFFSFFIGFHRLIGEVIMFFVW